MLNINQLIIDAFVAKLRGVFQEMYGDSEPLYAHTVEFSARQALEHIANTDTLYHNIEHTGNVALAGSAILKGKQIHEGSITPRDWMHFMLALVFHDIGFVRGLCKADQGDKIATGIKDKTIVWQDGRSAAILTPYHVDRSKLFLQERFKRSGLLDIDITVVSDYIERTRFPVPDDPSYTNTDDLPGLVRAADLIGQLADPNYLRKIPALFYEFEETGMNKAFGYHDPGEMRSKYPSFFSNTVEPYIHDALPFLRITQEGQQWITSLYGNVLVAKQGNNQNPLMV